MTTPSDLTQYLNKSTISNDDWQKVWLIVYQQLKRLARQVKSNHRVSETLNTTSLVHDVFLKFQKNQVLNVEGKKHFYRMAARAMRQILIDAARAKLTNKRKASLVEWDDEFSISLQDQKGTSASDLLAIDAALNALKKSDETLVEIIELHFFTGYTFAEIATILGVSESTVYREWKKARAWLYAYINETQ